METLLNLDVFIIISQAKLKKHNMQSLVINFYECGGS